ncbi:ATP-dependent chaperone ClpB, partial [Mesorhizobium sp. M2D.F.Ca.ET.140.01.1.1]
LRRQDMDRIVEIQLKRLENLLVDRKITLSLDPEAVEWLAAKGYDPAYGARPLKRVMQKELQDPLAEKILLGEILDGSTVKVTAGSDRLNFRSRPTIVAAEAAA